MIYDDNTLAILNIAKWAIKKTRAMIPYSGNLPDPKVFLTHRALIGQLVRRKSKNNKGLVNEIFHWNLDLSSEQERYPLNSSEIFFAHLNKFIPFRGIINHIRKLPYNLQSNSLEWVEKSAIKSLKFGLGNCEEVSAYSFLLLLELDDEEMLSKLNGRILVERICFVLDADHCFLILNRKKGELSDLLSWNMDAIICDSWKEEEYTLHDLLENKNEEEKQFLLGLFKNEAQWIAPMAMGDFFIGRKNNKQIHSHEWLQKINDNKYWRPRYLTDLQNRDAFTKPEKLPPFRLLPSKFHNKKKKINPLPQTILSAIKYRIPIDPSMLRFSPLHRVIMSGNREKLREILEVSPQFLQNQVYDKTPIVAAAHNWQWDLVSIIADYPTDLIDQAQYGNALLAVIRANEFPLAFKLIKAGASTDWQCKKHDGNSVFHYAIIKDNKELLCALLKAINKPVLMKNCYNQTPLEMAVFLKRMDLIDCFADYPTDPNDNSGYGLALWAAYSMKKDNLMIRLLKAGASIPTLAKRNTLIDYAIENNHTGLMEILLERGFCDEDFLDHLQSIEDCNHLEVASVCGQYYLRLYLNKDSLDAEKVKELGEMYWGLLGLYLHFNGQNKGSEELLILKEVSGKNPASPPPASEKKHNHYNPGFFFSVPQFQYDSQFKFQLSESPELSYH